MVNLKPRFRVLLASITLAIVLVGALPRHERKLGQEPGINAPALVDPAGRAGATAEMGLPAESGASTSNDPGNHSVENDRGLLFLSRLATERDVGGEEMVDQINKRRSHHHHRPDDTSKGGHSEHWYEHHRLDSHHPHRHSHEHHHRRLSGPCPRRLRGYTDEGGDTFIAPASIRVKAKHRTQSGLKKSLEKAPGKMVKKLKTTPTGLYRAVRPAETGTDPSVASSGQVPQKSGGQMTSSVVRRDLATNNTTSNPSNRSVSVAELSTRVVGVIDLVARVNGTMFGGLSISRMLLATSEASSDNTSYVLDATPNPSEQTKFYMRRLEKQPAFVAPSMLDTQDVLVSLQAQIPALERSLCATFNPLALDLQTMGLAPCFVSYADGSTNASQTFRFSAWTGVVRPFYGAEDILMDADTEWANNPGSGYLDSINATADLALDGTPLSLAPPHSFLHTVPLFNTTAASQPAYPNSTPGAMEQNSPIPPSDLPPALVIGDSEYLLSLASPGETKDEGILMVFRRVRDDLSEDAEHSQDARLKVKRGLGDEVEPIQGLPRLVDNVLPRIEASGPKGDSSATFKTRRAARISTSKFKQRAIGSKAGSTGQEEEPSTEMREDTGIADSRTWIPNMQHSSVSGALPTNSRSQPHTDPKAHTSSKNAVNPVAHHQELDQLEDESEAELDDTLLPKPMINVAYFGDSGRSPPVPPEDQADNMRAILVADPSKNKKPGAHPVVLATPGRDSGAVGKEDIAEVYVVAPPSEAKGDDRTASVAGVKYPAGANKPIDMPLDASD
ncbi:hypothetical protein FRC09_020202 [Ceratobasidium sp. 395]|nr:hypothetical protein FRC09_020202 [Ceratobasidium sp. 395]